MVVSSACMTVAIMMQTVSAHRTDGAMVSYSGWLIGAPDLSPRGLRSRSPRHPTDLVLRRREAASKDGSSARLASKAHASFWSIPRGSCFARAPRDERGGRQPALSGSWLCRQRSFHQGGLGGGEALHHVVRPVGEVGEHALHRA